MFLHGASARASLVRSVHRFHVLLRCAVRVRPSRLRQRCSEGVSPGKISRRKANGKNRETKKEPLIHEQAPALREWGHSPPPAIAKVSIGKGTRKSFAFSICKTGRARFAARKLVSGVGAIAACAAISHSANCWITRETFSLRLRLSVNCTVQIPGTVASTNGLKLNA